VWTIPTSEKINFLAKELKQINSGKYDLFLIGGVVNGKLGNTWDIDIVVNGEMDYQVFEDFLHDVYNLALNKHGLLVDVRWLDKKPVDNKNNIEYSSIRFGYARKKIDDVEAEINLFKKGRKVSEYLVEQKFIFPTPKAKQTDKIKYIKL
jgi:hypothetical protein